VIRSTRRAALTALAFAFATGAQVRAATRPTPGPTRVPPLKVAIAASEDAALPYFARENGVFEKAGLDIELRVITDAVAMRAALAAGALDIGYSDVISAAIAHDQDPPFVFLAGSSITVARDAAAGILVVGRLSAIRNAGDLEGKTVAVDSVTGVNALAVRRWIDKNGGNSTRVTLVEGSTSALTDAVIGGKVAAASISRAALPVAGRNVDALRVLANTYDAVGGRWIQAAWLTTPAWIVRHPDEAQAYAAAMKESAAWANAHRHESALILARVLRGNADKIEAEPRAEYAVDLTPALIEPVIEMCAKYGVITATFPAADLIDPLAR
jgi:NitT/TauT family transport system substrate-binding protein